MSLYLSGFNNLFHSRLVAVKNWGYSVAKGAIATKIEWSSFEVVLFWTILPGFFDSSDHNVVGARSKSLLLRVNNCNAKHQQRRKR